MAVEQAGYVDEIVYAMDLAANSWFNRQKNVYELDGKQYDRDALIDLYRQVAQKYPPVSMEDPLHEEDFNGFPASPGSLLVCRSLATICL